VCRRARCFRACSQCSTRRSTYARTHARCRSLCLITCAHAVGAVRSHAPACRRAAAGGAGQGQHAVHDQRQCVERHHRRIQSTASGACIASTRVSHQHVGVGKHDDTADSRRYVADRVRRRQRAVRERLQCRLRVCAPHAGVRVRDGARDDIVRACTGWQCAVRHVLAAARSQRRRHQRRPIVRALCALSAHALTARAHAATWSLCSTQWSSAMRATRRRQQSISR
jgi:hypothetical protein